MRLRCLALVASLLVSAAQAQQPSPGFAIENHDLDPLLWMPAPPEVSAPDAYDAAHADAVRRGVPLVVLISGPDCPWCERLKRTLVGWDRQSGFAFALLDVSDPRAAPMLSGKAIPQTSVSTPGGKWRTVVGGAHTAESLAAKLGVTLDGTKSVTKPTTKPATRSSAGPWLSVNGSDPGAQHQVTLPAGMEPHLVTPNTEAGWRGHLEWHGMADAATATPERLALTHAAEHQQDTRVVSNQGGRRWLRWRRR